MEYRRSKYIGKVNIDEVFEGTPDEILEVLNGLDRVCEDLIYSQEDAVLYIRNNLREDHEVDITMGLIRVILELEEDYMRSVGIIED